jgi:hypothetical protein
MADDRTEHVLMRRLEPDPAAHVQTQPNAILNYELLTALRDVAYGELAKGAGTSGLAWRHLHDVISAAIGDEPAATAQQVRGRQPSVMPRQKNPPPATNGAQPVWPGQAVHSGPMHDAPPEAPGAIRQRADVAAELARINAQTGGVVAKAEDK